SLRMRRWLIIVMIGNAEPAAEIDVLDSMAVGAQRAHELGQQRKRIVERRKIGDLAADMHVDAGDLQARQPWRMGIDLARVAQWNSKLVLRLAGRDLVVGLGIDVRIDPHRDIGNAALTGCDRGQKLKLGLGFDIDAENSLVDRERKLARSLADAGE